MLNSPLKKRVNFMHVTMVKQHLQKVIIFSWSPQKELNYHQVRNSLDLWQQQEKSASLALLTI